MMHVTPSVARAFACLIVSAGCLLAGSTSAAGQEPRTIHGVVVDSAGGPVSSAQIFVDEARVGVLSDPNGAFELTVPSGVDGILRVQRIGYASWSRPLGEIGDGSLAVVLVERPLRLDVVCTMDVRRSIVITVVDDVSGEPLRVEARGHIRDGSFLESLGRYQSRDGVVLSYAAGSERPGTYMAFVSAPGYEDWQGGPYEVTRDECHVVTAGGTARLIPRP